ncbi:MBOAT family protein [Aequorivita viscosa]|nr:MBOAT family protein [Aequorivita viscosa]
MYFNSITFAIFFIIVFFVYWFVLKRKIGLQNIFILIASYVFYGWWDWRFLSLIAFSTLVDFFLALKITKIQNRGRRKLFLAFSLLINLGLLAIFKYYNFFIENWIDAWASFGINMSKHTMNIILPVGISFYTFQTLSYTIDVYRNKMKPTKNLVDFAAYVAFFPQLVAGPIERASHLLPQFQKERKFNYSYAQSGIHLIIWGLFQKVVIADSCAIYVNDIFENYEQYNGLTLAIGAIYFAFQIYGDFAGYSNIAIGTARLLGFNLMRNFNYPYFARDIAEFWRRWHISLSTWFRDYLYIPLGGSRGSVAMKVRNVFIIFIVSGFWHGANWTFLVWGAIHAFLFLPLLLANRNRNNLENIALDRLIPSLKEFYQITSTFILVTCAWIFFRADSISIAMEYLKYIFIRFKLKIEYLPIERYSVELIGLIALFIAIEWLHRNFEHPFVGKLRWLKIIFVLIMLVTLGVYSNYQEFIYFQF